MSVELTLSNGVISMLEKLQCLMDELLTKRDFYIKNSRVYELQNIDEIILSLQKIIDMCE